MNRIVLFSVIALVKSALGTALNTNQDVCSICFKTKTYTYTRRRRTFTRTSTTTLPHCTTTKHSKNYTSKKLQRKKKHRHHHKSTTTHLSANSTISNSTPTSIKSRSLFIPTETSLSPLVITTSTLASTSTSASMSTSTSTSMSTSPLVSSSSLIPITTSSMLPVEPTDIMPADLTPTPVIPISNNLVLSGNNPPNKALGIGLGICIGSVAAFALVGLLYLSKRSKPHTATDPGQINTKWRPQSFMNVVASVVAKLPRSPSQRSK